MRNLRGAQRFLGLFFLLVYSDADWLGRQTPITWSGTDAKWVNVKVKVKMGTRDVCTGCCRSVRHLVFLKLLAFSMAHTPLFWVFSSAMCDSLPRLTPRNYAMRTKQHFPWPLGAGVTLVARQLLLFTHPLSIFLVEGESWNN